MTQPIIRKRILDKIGQYCQSVNMTIEDYINNTLDDAINLAIYGDINDKIKPMEQVVASKTTPEEAKHKVAETETKDNQGRATWYSNLAQDAVECSKETNPIKELQTEIVNTTTKPRKRVRTITSK